MEEDLVDSSAIAMAWECSGSLAWRSDFPRHYERAHLPLPAAVLREQRQIQHSGQYRRGWTLRRFGAKSLSLCILEEVLGGHLRRPREGKQANWVGPTLTS